MKHAVCGLVLFGFLGLVFLAGCSDATKARVDVIKKKILNQIDDAIGKVEVKKAEIENNMKSAKQAAVGVRKAKIRAQISLEQLDEKVRPYQDKIARCDETLAKLYNAIKADKPADFAGKTFTVDQLNEMAGKVIQSRKDVEEQVKQLEASRQKMQKTVADLSNKQQYYDTRISILQTSISKLDAEMLAANAIKDGAKAMGDENSTLSENLDELEKKIADISVDISDILTNERVKWTPDESEKIISEVDSFIKSTQTSNDRLAEIEKILGPAKKLK
jgi:chromosome segregation ATPase